MEAVEQLLLNALAEKGYTYCDGKVVSVRPPEEKEGESVDKQGEVRYNRNGGSYSQYSTTAMQWANSSSTEKGDTKVLYDPQTNTWNRIVADDSAGGYSVVQSVKDTAKNQAKINEMIRGRKMTVTKSNEALISAFLDIMIAFPISDEAIGMIVAMLPNEEAMTNLVDYLKTHQKATEDEIFKEAEKISRT